MEKKKREKKYKIRIPNREYQLILDDSKFYSMSKNALLNRIIQNYESEYSQSIDEKIRKIQKILNGKIGYGELYYKLLKFNDIPETDIHDTLDCQIIPVKETKEFFEQYSSNSLKFYEPTFSEFLKNIIISYCSMPKYQREMIIFKKTYDTIKHAIQKCTPLKIEYYGHENVVYPYSIEPSTDQVGNYLVLEKENKDIRIYKLYQITGCTVLDDRSVEFTKTDTLNKIRTNGSRYNIDSFEHTIIYLTNYGKYMFDRVFHDKPTPISIVEEKNTVQDIEFNWKLEFDYSGMGIDDYFIRFGAEAYYLPSNYNYEKIKKSAEKLYKLYE